jgi:hypothetical protein
MGSDDFEAFLPAGRERWLSRNFNVSDTDHANWRIDSREFFEQRLDYTARAMENSEAPSQAWSSR